MYNVVYGDVTSSGQSSGSGGGFIQRRVVQWLIRYVVLLRLKVQHGQHGVHHPGQRVLNHHVQIVPATWVHEHPVHQHSVLYAGELHKKRWGLVDVNEKYVSEDKIVLLLQTDIKNNSMFCDYWLTYSSAPYPK